nr:MAG TPA: hypothetical protein [Caudoviricetes sp.]
MFKLFYLPICSLELNIFLLIKSFYLIIKGFCDFICFYFLELIVVSDTRFLPIRGKDKLINLVFTDPHLAGNLTRTHTLGLELVYLFNITLNLICILKFIPKCII